MTTNYPRVMDYQTGARLTGTPSKALLRESDAAEPTGAVPAYKIPDTQIWDYVQPSQVEALERQGYAVRTVYTEAD